jgi:hypothetical protein
MIRAAAAAASAAVASPLLPALAPTQGAFQSALSTYRDWDGTTAGVTTDQKSNDGF